ncbi:MAG TPA: SDR family oxidoreductase, partial [Planctomycetaceae bacterium]|nr:SDR family oxidoreductase [Planctomycetaceae bacterium]
GDAACEVAREIEALGRRAVVVQADVADQAAVERMVGRCVDEFGELNLFVSNAALSKRQLMIDADMESFRRTIDVTMWGAFYGVRAAAQQMVRQGRGGAIVVVSSPHAVVPIAGSMAYNMAKAAIDHMARTAAMELTTHRIRVNIIHPGWIDTPGERRHYTEEQIREGAKMLPWKRLGTSEEVAKAICYLLSDDADYITGSTLLIDGGITLPWHWARIGE